MTTFIIALLLFVGGVSAQAKCMAPIRACANIKIESVETNHLTGKIEKIWIPKQKSLYNGWVKELKAGNTYKFSVTQPQTPRPQQVQTYVVWPSCNDSGELKDSAKFHLTLSDSLVDCSKQ